MNEHPRNIIPFTHDGDDDDAEQAPRQEVDERGCLWDKSFNDWQNFDPSKLDPRKWIYGRHYLEGAVSATVADDSIGKSKVDLWSALP
jgi:hypothetical protein